MPAYNPSLYPSHPIQIPEELPKILKHYTKAAIRTQPSDLLLWSASYFRCLANGEIPPVKERLEYPLPETWHGLTSGLIRVLHKQIGSKGKVHVTTLKSKWRGLSMEMSDLYRVLREGGWQDASEIEWMKFLALTSAGVAHDTGGIPMAMKVISEAHSDLSKGDGISLSTEEFIEYFKILAHIKALENSKVKEVVEYLESAGEKQGGLLSYENFKADLCPALV